MHRELATDIPVSWDSRDPRPCCCGVGALGRASVWPWSPPRRRLLWTTQGGRSSRGPVASWYASECFPVPNLEMELWYEAA